MTPTLYLIPSSLGENFQSDAFPNQIKSIIEKLDYFIVENEKEARRFIKKITPDKKQSTLKLFPLNKHTSAEEIATYLNPCLEGNEMGLISDAGCPGIADPGAVIVQKAYPLNIKVKPLVGPSSILLAMMGSGLNGQNFAFNGYLPIDKAERRKAIKAFEKKSIELNQTQVFIETPYRNMALLNELSKALRPKTQLSVACDITLPTEFIKTATAETWRNNKENLHKRPAVFSLLGG